MQIFLTYSWSISGHFCDLLRQYVKSGMLLKQFLLALHLILCMVLAQVISCGLKVCTVICHLMVVCLYVKFFQR